MPARGSRRSCLPAEDLRGVRTFDEQQQAHVYPIRLENRLPTILIPLLPGDAGVEVVHSPASELEQPLGNLGALVGGRVLLEVDDGHVADVARHLEMAVAEELDPALVGHDGLGVVDQRFVVVERDDAHLIRREPEWEVACVMLNEEADEPLMRAERRILLLT